MFGSFSNPNTSGTGLFSTSTGQKNGEQPPSYNESFKNITIEKGPNKGQNQGLINGKKGTNNGKNKGPNNQEEQSNFNPNNEGVFSIPIIKEFSNLNTKNIEIAEQEGMIGCNLC